MLTYTDLVLIERSLRNVQLLSVYLDGTADDFAARRAWRVQLENALKDLRIWLADSSHAEREQFERCVLILEERLASLPGGVGTRGWMAFITPDGVRVEEHLPVPMPTLAVWSIGASVAPYIRALKQTRRVVVVVADARQATLYCYDRGALDKVMTIHSQMLKEVAEHAVRLAGTDGWLLTGGIPQVSAELEHLIAHSAPGRVLNLESLDIHASEAEITVAAELGASTLRDALDLYQIEEIMGHANGNGSVALGSVATCEALKQLQVRELYLTHAFIEDHAADADDAVRKALDQHALVEEVSREAARRLDGHGGMAARLRYRPPATEASTLEAEIGAQAQVS